MPVLLILNATANVGSTGRIADQVAEKAIKYGWDCYLAYGRHASHSKCRVYKVGDIISVVFHYINHKIFDREGLASCIPTHRLISFIKKVKPDVIHIHNIHDHWLNYRALFKYLNQTNIKVVWTIHDCWPFTGHCYHFASVGCKNWKDECHDCPLIPRNKVDKSRRNYQLKRTLFSANMNLNIVSVSKWMEEIVKDSFFKDLPIQTIYNGIDLDVFKPRDTFLKEKLGLQGKFVIVASGTVWEPYKGLNDYSSLRKVLPDDFAILFVGVSERYKSSIPDGIVAVERTSSSEELSEYYSMADCVMSLSQLESFGLTIIEGMACGTPCVVFDSNSALSELVTPETGLVVENRNISKLCDAVFVIKNKGKKYFSSSCRKRAEDLFDKDKCFSQYIELYNSLI